MEAERGRDEGAEMAHVFVGEKRQLGVGSLNVGLLASGVVCLVSKGQ